MNTLVLYESQFGNTRQIAKVIGAELEAHGPVRVMPISDYHPLTLQGVDMVIVGGPTQVHGMAGEMRKFLDGFESVPKGIPAAAFDTRLGGPAILTGSASRGIQRQLKSRGFKVIAEPASFLVKTDELKHTVLVPGEADRAAEWAKTLPLLTAVPA